MKKPTVSIGMPVYNGEPFIREAIDSLLAQTFTDFELIISDNASTDGTEAICLEYAAKDARIRYVRQAENLGASANFKFVLDEAVGEFFLWAAADDLQKPDFINALYMTHMSDKDLVCVMSDVYNIGKDGSLLNYLCIDNLRPDYIRKGWKSARAQFFRNPTSNIFFCIYGLHKADVIRKVSLNYRGLVKYASASEIPLLAQLSLEGPITAIAVPLKGYRRHDDSIYHQEQRTMDYRSRLRGFLNISQILCIIVKDARKSASEKILLYFIVTLTGLRWIFVFHLKLFVRKLIQCFSIKLTAG